MKLAWAIFSFALSIALFVLFSILMARQPYDISTPLPLLFPAFSVLALFIAFFFDFKKKSLSVHDAPTAFMKKCVECGREIPIASEECQYCGTKQPEYVEP